MIPETEMNYLLAVARGDREPGWEAMYGLVGTRQRWAGAHPDLDRALDDWLARHRDDPEWQALGPPKVDEDPATAAAFAERYRMNGDLMTDLTELTKVPGKEGSVSSVSSVTWERPSPFRVEGEMPAFPVDVLPAWVQRAGRQRSHRTRL